MGDIVHLNQFRKRRERELNEARLRRNRAKSSKSKAGRNLLRHEIEARRRDLDGKCIDRSPGEE